MPPQIVALVLAGAGLYAGYKWLAGHTDGSVKGQPQTEPEPDQAHSPAGSKEPRNLGALKFDPATKTYRPSAR